jgi:hypothetical protein
MTGTATYARVSVSVDLRILAVDAPLASYALRRIQRLIDQELQDATGLVPRVVCQIVTDEKHPYQQETP